MPVYRKCTQCGIKVLDGTLCNCEVQNRKNNYKQYKYKRLQDDDEKERQKFYSSDTWLSLSDNIKKNFFGLCVTCWHKGITKENEFTHHIETMKERFDLRLHEDNLIPVCDSCHKKIHKLMEKSNQDKVKIQEALKDLIKEFYREFY